MGMIHRDTIFRVDEKEKQLQLLDAYRVLQRDAVKDGKPYILNVEAHLLLEDGRSQAYTVMARTTFASVDDMSYFDKQCAAHKALWGKCRELVRERPLVVNAKVDELN